MLYKVGECIFLLFFFSFAPSYCCPMVLSHITCVHLRRTHRCNSSPPPFNSQTTCIQRKLSWSIKSTFVVSVYDCSCHYLTVICIRLLDGTSETCKYLNDSPERNASPTRCMYQSERWMSAGCCRHRTAACARMCARQNQKSRPFFPEWSDDRAVTWKTQRSDEMQSNWSRYECIVCWEKQGFSLIFKKKNMITMYVHAY